MNTKTLIRRPRRLDLRTVSLDAPLPITLTCKGMGLAWPSGSAETALCPGCGGYVDACQCGNYPPDGWEEDALLDYCREECARLQLPPVPALPPSMLCAVCGIANIHGPRCFGNDCPNPIR
jgi:hypothetical protein